VLLGLNSQTNREIPACVTEHWSFMGDILYLIAFLALPVISYLWVRSLTWLAIWIFAASALVGSFIDFTIDMGRLWDLPSLKNAVLVTLVIVAVAAFLSRSLKRTTSVKIQMLSIGAPIVVALLFVVLSRVLAIGHAGPWSAVGVFVQRIFSEDSAKWLDFAGQLMSGGFIDQAVPMGGPLQLAVVFTATIFSVISTLAFGGVNQVYVASNSILFLQFGLAALSPIVLAPLAEMRLKDGGKRIRIPAPALWVGGLALMAGSFAVSGLGHLTFQYSMLVVGLWFAVFLAGSHVPHARVLTSVSVAVLLVVWFPMLAISIVLYIALIGYFIYSLANKRSFKSLALPIAMTILTLVFTWQSLVSTFTYIFELDSTVASGAAFNAGGVSAGALIPALVLLNSQGGTEQATALLTILALLTLVLALRYLNRIFGSAQRTAVAFAPIALIGAFALALQVLGTWYAGSGPNYGALKMTFFIVILTITVTTPFAVMELDRSRTSGRFPGLTPVRVGALAGIVFVLAIDGLLTRAVTYVSPEQWPSTDLNRNYWWPAEVRPVADQSIASNPIGCVYLEPGDEVPTVLKDGQRMYACTRILAGLSGMDTIAQPLVDFQRREWLTNQEAWLDEYPRLLNLPPEVLAKKMILISGNNDVVGLESIDALMQRYKPLWAQ
jgi:hypothetical protein